MTTYLDKILESHRRKSAQRTESLDTLIASCDSCEPTRPFGHMLGQQPKLAVIAEIKRRSPSKGELGGDVDVTWLASEYERGGAAAISVLTDANFFGGSAEDLRAAKQATSLPVLRKDFTVSAFDVVDARLMGADALLLIVAALDNTELRDFYDLATELGLGVLIEAHDEREVERTLRACTPEIIGINQRDLVTFDVDAERALRVAQSLPTDIITIAESGIRSPEDIPPLLSGGFDGVLVGEHLVTQNNPAAGVAALIGD